MRNSMRWLPVVLAIVGAAAASSCSSSDSAAPGGEAGSGGGAGTGGSGGSGGADDAGDDAAKTDGGDAGCVQPAQKSIPHCSGELPVMKVRKSDGAGGDTYVNADWSCLGKGPSDGGVPDLDGGGGQSTFRLRGFSSGDPMVSVDVDMFWGNAIVDKTVDFSGTTAGPGGDDAGTAAGDLLFPTPGVSKFAYRVKEKANVTRSLVEFDVSTPAVGAGVEGNGIAPSLFNTLAIAAVPIPGWTPPTDLGILALAARDCNGDDVEGAQGEIWDDDANAAVVPCSGKRDPHYVYFDESSLPNTYCTYTNATESLFIVINAPVNSEGANKGHHYSFHWKGLLADGDTQPTVFATKSLEIFPNAINVHQVRPQ